MAGAGAMAFLDLGEAAYEGARAGEKDLRRGAPDTMGYIDKQAGQMPPALARMAKGSGPTTDKAEAGQTKDNPLLLDKLASAPPALVGLADKQPLREAKFHLQEQRSRGARE